MGARAIYIPTKSRSDSTTENHKISNGMPGGMPRNSYEDKLQESTEEIEVNYSNPTFFGAPLSASSVPRPSRWNPFAKKYGIFGVIHAHSKRNRVVSKHGKLNTYRKPDENREKHRYLKDFFTSMIDLSWSWTLLGFAASFYFSWVVFALVWFLVLYCHGDLAANPPPDHHYCVDNVKSFTECFLFSLETQHTIGYGSRAPTENCSLALVIMSIQSIVGVADFSAGVRRWRQEIYRGGLGKCD